ncbi:hypothetical protein Tco_0973452 [Tanacetum coccineum]
MPTEMELTLEQTQQGVSYEVSVFTMKMEILLEPTSNKLMVEHAEYDESNTYVLERFNTTAGNPVKKILLKLNLSDHRLFKDGGGEKRIEREQAANLAVQKEQEEQAAQSFTLYWNFPIIDDDDDEYTIQYREYLERSSKAITPDLPTEEPDNSLSMGDEHLSTIPETESDKLIKSSVENLVPIPSEAKVIFDNMCDVPFCDKNHFDAESDLMESLLNQDTSIVYSPKIRLSLLESRQDISLIEQLLYDDYASSDDDTFYSEDIDYVEASPPDFKLVSLEEVKDLDTEDGEIDTDILLTIKDDILREKLRNINLLIAKIESLNDNPTPDFVLKSHSSFPIPVKDSDFFLEKFKTFLSLPEAETL